jgi:hypothetical protein
LQYRLSSNRRAEISRAPERVIVLLPGPFETGSFKMSRQGWLFGVSREKHGTLGRRLKTGVHLVPNGLVGSMHGALGRRIRSALRHTAGTWIEAAIWRLTDLGLLVSCPGLQE